MDIYYHSLDDDLVKLYYNFKRGVKVDNKLLQGFLRYYRPPHKTNIAQLQRCGIEDRSLLAALASSGCMTLPLEELCESTAFKYILSSQQTEAPYINIKSNITTTELVYSFKKNESRTFFIEHVKSLLSKSKIIIVADKYLNNCRTSVVKFFDILPSNASVFLSHPLNQELLSELKKTKPNIKIKIDTVSDYKTLHDRYILIDDKVEVILTSGVDYIFDTNKECTAIIRAV